MRGAPLLVSGARSWEFMNMNRVVELGSQDRATLGRAYSAGVSNVGVFAHKASFQGGSSGGSSGGGELKLGELYFGISQTVSAPSISVSAVTVGGALCLTVQYAEPVWEPEQAGRFADDLVRTLEAAAAQDYAAAILGGRK